jgi:GTP cyclohydrolase I
MEMEANHVHCRPRCRDAQKPHAGRTPRRSTIRGVRKPGSMTITSSMRGGFLNPATRAELMALVFGGK